MQVRVFNDFQSYQQSTQLSPVQDVSDVVRGILQEVQQQGDSALRQYTERFDGVLPDPIRIPPALIREHEMALDADFRKVLMKAADHIRTFHERQKRDSEIRLEGDGTLLGWKVTPVDSVGLYVPGGRAVYPSTLLMNAIPALVAGVRRIAVVSPPSRDTGLPHPLVLACCGLLGLEEVYRVGGAQSIAALAYGTKSMPPVVKITGPGNAYVAEAKRQVYGKVGIDSIAGPSEILIICNVESMPVEYLVRDLLSQAEHDPDARSLLITTSQKQAQAVKQRLEELVPTLPRKEIIEASFNSRSALLVVDNLETAFEITNEVAPEHLELLTDSPMEHLHRVRNAGAIFIGPDTPEPVGDYYAGPNHTLPTEGCAKFSSPLGVYDFVKQTSLLRYSPERLKQQGEAIMEFARREDLHAHAAAVKARLDHYLEKN